MRNSSPLRKPESTEPDSGTESSSRSTEKSERVSKIEKALGEGALKALEKSAEKAEKKGKEGLMKLVMKLASEIRIYNEEGKEITREDIERMTKEELVMAVQAGKDLLRELIGE